jgi:hypothetical protein
VRGPQLDAQQAAIDNGLLRERCVSSSLPTPDVE